MRELEPLLHPDVIGGWWFPEDASVDARRLTNSLRAACVAAGVQILMGPETAAASLELAGKQHHKEQAWLEMIVELLFVSFVCSKHIGRRS